MEEINSTNEFNEQNKNSLKTALYLGSRSAWGFSGGCLMLNFMSENLYLENQIYPYAALISASVALILACLMDALFRYITEK